MTQPAATAPLALRVHSIMLGVRDVDASVAFYTEQLGLPLCGRFGDFAFVEAGGTMLTLSADLPRARPLGGPESVEIVLAVESVRAAYDALSARGLTFVQGPRTVDGTHDAANFEDPDGHLLSLYGSP